MILSLLALQALHTAPSWPAVAGASVQRLKPSVEAPSNPDLVSERETESFELKSAPKGRTVELLFQAKPGTILNYGPGHQFIFKGGRLVAVNRTTAPEMEMSGPWIYDVAFTQQGATVAVFCNGQLVTRFPAPKTATFASSHSMNALVAMAVYPRALTVTELGRNAKAAPLFADATLPETKTVSLGLKLMATTPVPDPARLKPYRNALLAQEYIIVSLASGHRKGLKPGGKIRVLRYGVFDGQKTDLQYLQPGNVVNLVVEPLDGNPVMQREYQLDELSSDFSAPYYVEVRGTH